MRRVFKDSVPRKKAEDKAIGAVKFKVMLFSMSCPSFAATKPIGSTVPALLTKVTASASSAISFAARDMTSEIPAISVKSWLMNSAPVQSSGCVRAMPIT